MFYEIWTGEIEMLKTEDMIKTSGMMFRVCFNNEMYHQHKEDPQHILENFYRFYCFTGVHYRNFFSFKK